MTLPFVVSWLCTLLLWGCICFPPQQGYNIAHGYSVSDDRFSSHAGVLGPQPSNQFQHGASLNTNHDFVNPRDEMQAMRHQSFVSSQREPVHHENNEDASSVTSLGEEMVQSKPHSDHEPDTFSVQKYEHEGSGFQQPFSLLVKDTQKKTMNGVSFPTIRDFKLFIETMKSSFLIPGSDMRRHFQTARETMENEVASNAQNIKGEPDTSHRSNSAKQGTAHDDASENEVWSEPMNAVFERNEQGTNYQMPSESHSVAEAVDSAAGLISTSVYDNQDSGSALYPHLAAKEHVASSYGSFDSGGISEENPNVFTNAPEDQSSNYKLPEQTPSGSFFREDFAFSGHETASPINPPDSPSQDLSYHSSKTYITPLTSEKNVQQPHYTPHGKDSLTLYQKPSGGFEIGKDFQSDKLRRVTPANVLSSPKPSNSYGKSVYVKRRSQLSVPDYLPKRRERPAPSFPTAGKASKDINYTPTAHLPVSSSSASSSSDNLSPQSSSVHGGIQLSSRHDAQNQAFNGKQPVKQVFLVKPSGTLHGSSRHDGHVGDQSLIVTHPSILSDEEKDDTSGLNPVSTIQEPKQMNDNILSLISGSLDSTQSGMSSLVGADYASFNSLANLAPTSAPERAFSRLVGNEIMSRNFGIKNIITDRFPTGDIRDARYLPGSFFTTQRRGKSLNGGYGGAPRPGFLQTFIQPTKLWKRPANVNKKPSNMVYLPSDPLSASTVSGSTLSDVFRTNGGNTKKLPNQTGPSMPTLNAYIVKSRNGYVRSKVSRSKTHYAPHQLDEDATGKDQWRPAPMQRKDKNTVSHNAKGYG